MADRSAKDQGKEAAASAAIRVAGRLRGRVHIPLDYPPNASNEPRWGHGRPANPALEELIAAGDDRYAGQLGQFLDYADDLAAIDRHPSDPARPAWINGWQPGLDSLAIYAFIRARAPRLYLEIGSGHSTSFASQAIRDGKLETTIVSIDPQPRSEIDALCDEIVRSPLESADLGVFDRLAPGDVLFFDGSHRTFMNSDVTAFFLDVLPRVPAGVLVGVHDIYLPDDYPPDIAERYYSEQYMLAAMLLGARGSVELVLPSHYVSGKPELAGRLDPLWSRPELSGVEQHGVAFWFVSP